MTQVELIATMQSQLQAQFTEQVLDLLRERYPTARYEDDRFLIRVYGWMVYAAVDANDSELWDLTAYYNGSDSPAELELKVDSNPYRTAWKIVSFIENISEWSKGFIQKAAAAA